MEVVDLVEGEDLPFLAREEEGEGPPFLAREEEEEDLPFQAEGVVEVDPPFQEEEVEGVVVADLQTCLAKVVGEEDHQRVQVVVVEGVQEGAMKPQQQLQFLVKSSVSVVHSRPQTV